MRFQARSNMRVRPSDAKWVVKTLANEGASSPFMARLFMGPLKLRDIAYGAPSERDKFDRAFEQVTTALSATRDAARDFEALWRRHAERVSSGACVRRAPHRLFIDDDVDRELRRLMDSFLNASVRALKTGFPQLASELGVELGFWFQKPAAFERGTNALAATDALLANYVREARDGWSEQLILRRNSIEHEGWSLPSVHYEDHGATVAAIAPVVDGRNATAFMHHMLDRLCCAIEELTAHLLCKRMATGIGLHEIARDQRLAEAPERFGITATPGGGALWSLHYHVLAFEDV